MEKAMFSALLKEKTQEFNQYLEKSFPQFAPEVQGLAESMQYSLFAGGKRLRPILLLATLECINGELTNGYPFAAALEFIHTYSLVHDDLPCMDDDDLRRGLPTNHIKFGEGAAVLAGDGLLTHAFALVSDLNQFSGISPENLLRAIHLLSKSAGLFGMVSGQYADMYHPKEIEGKDLLSYIHENKTGALIRASIEIGAILGDVPAEHYALFSDFGFHAGKSFQIQDDILDETSSEEDLGKPIKSDIRNEKLTYPQLYGLERSQEFAEEHFQKAIDALQEIPYNTQPLEDLAKFIIHRSH